MKNAIGRDIPDELLTDGREVYRGNAYRDGRAYVKTGPRVRACVKPQESKVVESIREAIVRCGLKDGMTISFHHHFRDGDYIVRGGGEEILLVFRPMPRGDLPALGARICSTIASRPLPLPDGSKVTVTASVGLAECPPFPQRPDLLGWEQLVALADRALYWIKENGRNGWACYRARADAEPPADAAEATPAALIDAGLLVLRSDRERQPPGTTPG